MKAANRNKGAGEQPEQGQRSAAQHTTDRLLNRRQATPRARIIEDRRRDCNADNAAKLRKPRSAAVVISCSEVLGPHPRDRGGAIAKNGRQATIDRLTAPVAFNVERFEPTRFFR
jgi:hypothetical protein